MDMWKPFRNSTRRHAQQASILFDKFHVMRHLGEAFDQVRKSEYTRLRGKDRSVIKGQKYTLLSHRDNLHAARPPFPSQTAPSQPPAQDVAYLLKESFGQLWDYRREAWARRFFVPTGRRHLKWQRLTPYEKFAAMIDRPLGWHRRLLPSRQQGLPRLRRGSRQNPRPSTPCLWSAR